MTEKEMKKGIDDLVKIAENSSITSILNNMSQLISIYHMRKDDESLIKINYCMQVLLVKQGLLIPEYALRDCTTVIRERELIKGIKEAIS